MLFQAAPKIRCFILLATSATLWCATSLVCAQDADPDATAANRKLIDQLQPGTTLIYKDPETGEVRPVGQAPPEMVKQLQARLLLQKNAQLFEIQELKISGNVSADFVKLQTTLRIEIHADREWVRVPVGFDEFQLTDLKHTTDAPDGRATLEKSRLPVKNWLLYGKGVHRFELNLIGKAEVSQNGRWRLKLGAPAATISNLLLELNDHVETLELSTRQPYRLEHDESEKTTLETWGVSSATEITWTPALSETSSTVTVQSNARSQLKLDLATGSLVVDQQLSISGGSIDQLHVKLPPGFGTVNISGKNADGDEILRPAERSVRDAGLLLFTTPVTGTVSLHYDFGLVESEGQQDLSIQLPDIEEVSNESGDLEISVPVGLEVEIIRADLRDVRQIRVEGSRGPRTAQFGYRLLSSRSLLRMKVSATEAFYSVIPLVSFETERNNILMTARFSINMVRGSLNEIDIVWPDHEADSWQVLHEYTRLIAADTETILTGFEADSHTLRFPERMSGQFEIELQAFRPRSPQDNGKGMPLFLPDISSPTPHTTLVSLIDSDEFSMELTGQDGQTTFPQLPPSRWPESLKSLEKPLSVRLVDRPTETVRLQVTPQRAEVRVAVDAALALRQESIYVSETMSFDVRHLDLSEITLSLAGVNPSVRMASSNELLERIREEADEVTFALPSPVRGRFDLKIDYYWPPDTSEPGQLSLPLVLPSLPEEELTEITVGTEIPESLLLDGDTEWRRVFSARLPAAWRTTERRTTVPLLLQHSLQPTASNSPEFVILKSVLRGNRLLTSLTGVFRSPIDKAMFTMPDGVDVVEGFVGRQQSSSIDQVAQNSPSGRMIQIRADVSQPVEPAYTVTLVVSESLNSRSSLVAAWEPRLPRLAGTKPDTNSIWILGQNSSNSVIYCGNEMSELAGVAGTRLAETAPGDIRSDLLSLLSPYHGRTRDTVLQVAEDYLDGSFNCQILAGTAPQKSLTLLAVSRRATLLLTAIIGLLTYFVFLKLRSVSLITIVAIATVVGTMFTAVLPGAGQLILIRLAPGCALAIIAALLQRALAARPAAVKGLGGNHYEQSTIFTVEKPVLSSGGSTAAGSPSESVPGSSQLTVMQP